MLDPKIVLLGDSLKPFQLAKSMLKALRFPRVKSGRGKTGPASTETSRSACHQNVSVDQTRFHPNTTRSSTGAASRANLSTRRRRIQQADVACVNKICESTGPGQLEKATDSDKAALMSLPREIREIIYRHALFPGKAFPHAKPFKTGRPYTDMYNGLADGECEHPRPSLALLATCGRIHDEALPIYLSNNNFVVAKGDVGETMDFILELAEEKRVHIQSVTLRFHPSDLSTLSRAGVRTDIDLYFQQRGGITHYTPNERREIIHFFESIELEKIWREKYTVLSHLDHIKEITFDFTEAQCPMRCCTPGEIVLSTMQRIGCYGPNLPENWHLKVLQDYEAIKKEILGRDFYSED